MPFETIPGTTEQYALLSFDKNGTERSDDADGKGRPMSEQIIARAAHDQPSHVFLFSHGWKGDVPAAKDQYNRWIGAMLELKADRDAVPGPFTPLWIGLHWPSLPFGDEEEGGSDFAVGEASASPDEIVATYLDRLGLGPDAEPLIRTIVNAHRRDAAVRNLPADAAQAYDALATLAGRTSEGPTGPPEADGEPFDPQVAFDTGNLIAGTDFGGGGGLVGGILGPLRQLSYWTMKKRARTIGESGMHDFVASLMNAAPKARVHLMGHSFGCIVVASVIGGRDGQQPLPRPVDSLALIQGAVSLWAFGETVHGQARAGYFNPWVKRTAVRGPIVVSRSIHDKAVGTLYPWASAVSFADGSFGIDEEDLPLHGAIGAFGISGLKGAVHRNLLEATGQYGFEAGKVYNLESSMFIKKGDGVSGAHSDIDGPEVAHALWQAALV
ncbi:MAG: hypothetical protein ABIX28_16680 [Vicinamibacterales bacterium]